MTQFRERNPVPIALVGIALVIAALAVLFEAENFPFVPGGGGKTIHAYFVESSNLQTSDDVRIAGIKVGEVKKVSLATIDEKGVPTQVVEVSMKLDLGTVVDNESTASIRIKTLLGAMYVDIVPGGTAALKAPIDTTGDPSATPLIVTAAFQQLSSQVSQIDTTQLAQSFDVLSADFSGTSGSVSSALKGLAAVSQTISSRDAALQTLLTHAQGVTTALASRDAEVTKLIDDGQTVLTLVNQQRTVIHDLLLNTVSLSQQISGLVKDNTAVLKPALANLNAVTTILSKDQSQLDDTVYMLAPFLRDFTNIIGNGEWFDNYVQNLSSATTPGCFTAALVSPTQYVAPSGEPGAGCL